jgi:hypothetical protein
MGAQQIGELAQHALHLLLLFAFQLANAIAELDGRRRLDEQRSSGAGRAVHDPADLPRTLAANGDDVAPLANGHRHVGRAVMRLEPSHHPLENAHELTVRGAQFATDASQRGRRLVAHETILADRALDLLLFAPGDDHPFDERRQHGAQNRRAAFVTQRFSRAPRGAQEHGGREQLVRRPHRAGDPQPLQRAGELGNGLRMPWQVTARAARGPAPTRRCSVSSQARSDRGASARTRAAPSADAANPATTSSNRGYSRMPERVRVHCRRRSRTKNPNDARVRSG